jgi:4-aminobutyrate aminotransferase / (S)-3-amino-2-methylpropionate transaminase / 5-aminovalerate transaminase
MENPDSEILKIDDKYCSHGDTVHYNNPPKMFERAMGSYMYDSSKTKYLDLQMWYSACNFGYGNERINNALKNQIDTLPQLASQFTHKEKALLAEKICLANEKRFGKKGRVHFNVGGSQAVDDAIKVLRNTTGKNLAFAFQGGYHGRTLGASAITSSYRYRRRYGHFGDRAHFVPFPYCFRCPYDMAKDSCGNYCVKQFEKLFETEYAGVLDTKVNQSEFSYFFIEPIQGTGGYVIPPKGYFKQIKAILNKHNILLVSDEIQMGFYRTGKLWSIEHFDVVPDVIVFGKSLTNGMNALSGLWASEELIAPAIFPPGSTHSTFSSNPLGTRTGLEVMQILEDKDHEPMVMEKGRRFLDGLEVLKKKYKNIGDVAGLGLALRLEICEADGYKPSKALCDKVSEMGLSGQLDWKGEKVGLVLDVGGYYKNVLTLAPSLYITNEEIDMGLALLDQIFAKVF